MSGSAPKGFLFDVFGTVVDWRSGVIREVDAAMRARGLEVDAAAFADAWRGLYQPSMEAVRSGARGWTVLDTLHRESLDALLARDGLADAFDEAARQALTRAWWRLDPWPDAANGIERLRAVGMVGACSNGNVALIANMAKRGGLRWDAICGAEPARAYKPQPEAYLRSCDMLGVAPEEVVMVAAHASDLAAARAVGLRTAYVSRPLEFGAGHGAPASDADGWDVSVDAIDAVAAAFGG